MFDIYLASPLHTPEHRAIMDSAKHIIQSAGFTVFDPRESGVIIKDLKTAEERENAAQKVFEYNIKGLEESRAIIACIDDRDTGVAFELGYMRKAEKAFLVTFSAHGHGANVMLARAVNHHCPDLRNLERFLERRGKDLHDAIHAGTTFPVLRRANSNG